MKFAGFILIGGKSSRMGEDKFSLKLNQKTFLQIAGETLENAGIKQISVAASKQSRFECKFPIVTDLYQNRGALSGIHAALVNSTAEYIVVLACDLPFVSFDLIKMLRELAEKDSQFEAIVPLQSDGKKQPLCAVYQTKPCRKILSAMLENETKK